MRLRIVSFIAALLCCMSLYAQRCEHVVQRGEDFSSIAQKYGITVDELKASNPSSSLCYVGRKLLIPNPGQVVERKPAKVEPFDYGLVSSLGDSVLTKTTTTTYHVGEALWKQKKYAQAMVYLSSAAYGGDARAYYPLGDCYSQSSSENPDEETAATWYLKAVEGMKEKTDMGYYMPCLRLSKCYLTGKGMTKNVKQARHFYNEYKRYAESSNGAEAKKLQHDIAAEEAAIAKAENEKRIAIAKAEKAKREAEQTRRRQEALAKANKQRVVASNNVANASNRTIANNTSVSHSATNNNANSVSTTRNNVQYQRQANTQASASNGVQKWREELGMGGFVIVTKYPNGNILRVRYRLCPNCKGGQMCAGCYGSGRCGICKGQGGIVTSGYGRYIPCGLCGSSGVCSLCRGSRRCACTAASEYPGYVVGSTSAITPDGTTIRNTAGYNGRDDKFVITPPGGTSYTFDDERSTGSSSSRRSSSGSCSKCHGTKYDPQAMQYAAASTSGVRPPYHSKLGDHCPYCTSRADHYHYPCSGCMGTGHN